MIELHFDSWYLTQRSNTPPAYQYDDNTIPIIVTGNIPDGWDWNLLLAHGEYLDVAHMDATEDGLVVVLTAEQLAFDGYYTAQLRASQGEKVKHSSPVLFSVGDSLSGDEQWPEIPTAFTQAVERAEAAAEAAGTSRETAEAAARDAAESKASAAGSATAAQASQDAAESARDTAAAKATAAAASASEAAGSVDNARQAQEAAETAATEASGSASAAAGSATAAQTAQTGAETAQTAAEAAQSAAETAQEAAEAAQAAAEAATATKADKVTGAVAGHLAALDGTGNLLDAGKPLSDVVGGIAYNDKRIRYLYELTQGQAWDTEAGTTPAYSQTVPAGAKAARIGSIGGKTVVWNQHVFNGDFSDGTAGWEFIPSRPITVENGEATITVQSDTYYYDSQISIEAAKRPRFSEGHKAYVSAEFYFPVETTVNGYVFGKRNWGGDAVPANTWTRKDIIVNCDGTDFSYLCGNVIPEIGSKWKYRNIVCVDLTQMFGSGNEPTDTSDPRIDAIIRYAEQHPEYDAGSLLSAKVTEVESFRNKWDKIGYAVRTGKIAELYSPSDQIPVPISSGGAAAVNRDFDLLGIDEDEPVNPALSHVLTIQAHDVLDHGSIPFDPVQYLFAVTAAACAEYGWPATGMPVGNYNITLDHGAYNGSTTQDGTYQFTTTQIVPVGGGVRHSQIGAYRSDSDYSKANLLAGTFTTYAADRTTTLESGLVTTEGADGTNLGTTTASNPAYKVGNYINFSQRQAYGSGRWSTSFTRQYLNSDESTMTFTPATIWSRPMTTLPEGFLHKLPAELKAVLGKVRKRYALSIAEGYGYEDIEDTVNLVTMLDVNFGKNNNVSEGPVSAGGTVTRETPYTNWTGVGNADRIKYQGTTARNWWLGSSNPSNASFERYVYTSGALYSNGAFSTYGVVPSLFITGNGAAPLDTLEIPAALRTFLSDKGYGWSAGSVYNELNLEAKKYIQRVGSVDLGTLNWNHNGTQSDGSTQFIAPVDGRAFSQLNLICAEYITQVSVAGGTIQGRSNSNKVTLNSFDFSTAPEAKSALSGQMLYYELATPIEYDISSYLPADNLLTVEAGGMVTFVQEGDTQLQIPNSVDYLINLSEAI